jgi:hypothetical protein
MGPEQDGATQLRLDRRVTIAKPAFFIYNIAESAADVSMRFLGNVMKKPRQTREAIRSGAAL